MTTFPSVFPTDFLDFSQRGIFLPERSSPGHQTNHIAAGGEGFFSSEKMALASRCSSSLGTSRGPAERASARAVAPSGRDGRPSRGSRPSSRLRTLASGNRNKRCANAGLIVDEVQDVTSTTGAGEDDRGLAQGPDEGAQAREPEYDFDFEAEKTKLLNERKQLEEILERIEEHERSLASGEAVAGKPSASSASSPALLRRDRYRASLLRQRDGSGEKGAGGVVEEKAKKAKKKGSGRPKKQGVLGQGDFVSKSSEESLSVASTSSSSDAVTTLLQERRHLELLSREEEARLIESAQFCFLVEEAMAREGTFVKNAAKGSSGSRSGGGGGSANSGEVQKGYYEVVAKAINAGLSDGEAPLSVQQIKRRHLHAMEARRYMLDHNVRLVVHLAHRYRGKGVSLGDLVQEGHQGLLTALQKFDLERGLKFSTYATWWIRQSLIRALQNHGRDVRLPVHVTDTHARMAKLMRQHGSSASTEEIARMMNCKEEKVRSILDSTRAAISLDVLAGGNNNMNGQDDGQDDVMEDLAQVGLAAADEDEDEEYELLLQKDVEQELKLLPPRERNILRMRFGLMASASGSASLVDIGAAYGLTRERVRQMEARALTKLRTRSTQLEKYIEGPKE